MGFISGGIDGDDGKAPLEPRRGGTRGLRIDANEEEDGRIV